MFDGGVMEAFPQFFPARALGHCYVGARHDKLAAYDTPNDEVAYDFPTSVAGEPEKSSLGLHWDPLQISVFGTTFTRTRASSAATRASLTYQPTFEITVICELILPAGPCRCVRGRTHLFLTTWRTPGWRRSINK